MDGTKAIGKEREWGRISLESYRDYADVVGSIYMLRRQEKPRH